MTNARNTRFLKVFKIVASRNLLLDVQQISILDRVAASPAIRLRHNFKPKKKYLKVVALKLITRSKMLFLVIWQMT